MNHQLIIAAYLKPFIVKDATGIVLGPFAGAWDVLLRAMNLALGDLAQEHRARVLAER